MCFVINKNSQKQWPNTKVYKVLSAYGFRKGKANRWQLWVYL